MRVKAKNLFTNTINTLTFKGGERIQRAYVVRKLMQFLYHDGNHAIFMDTETFEQFEVPEKVIMSKAEFLSEGVEVNIIFYQDRILEIELPKNIVLTVTTTADAVRGDTVNNATKKATLETGLEIDVPQFIEMGNRIIINTETKKYVSRSN